MDGMSIDTSEIEALARDISLAGTRLRGDVKPVVSKGALNVKNAMRKDMSASKHFKGITRSIGYDMHDTGSVIEAEIGPSSEAGSPGNLANIAYFGGAHGGGGTVPDPQAALDAEAPNFEKALGDLLEDLL